MISLKIKNLEYAPGIATYGIDGHIGNTGESGNSIFFTNYDITTEFKLFLYKIKLNEYPLKNNTNTLTRTYINGDYFFDELGNIYQLLNIDNILSYDENKEYYYIDFLNYCGKLNAKSDDIITKNSLNRILLNSSYYGVDIINNLYDNAYEDEDDTYSGLRIINNVYNNNLISFIKLLALNNLTDIANLEVFYDINLNSFHIKSDYPIFIDSDLKINNSNTSDVNYDNYSSVLTNDSPITKFYNLANKIQYTQYNHTYKNSLGFDSSVLIFDTSLLDKTLNSSNNIDTSIYFNTVLPYTIMKINYIDSSNNYNNYIIELNDNNILDKNDVSIVNMFFYEYYNNDYIHLIDFNNIIASSDYNPIKKINSISLIYNIEVFLPLK